MRVKLGILIIAGAVIWLNSIVMADEEEINEEILFRPIVLGTLTQIDAGKSPVSMTVIDEEKLKLTPARNLYDILATYVPGFEFLSHFDATHMGLRGLVVDRDYNFILLVNGRMMNQQSHDGVITEMENWDLNDIEKIEVVRGPGSVTYGPGAVDGVISITTKNSVTSPGLSAGLSYAGGYNSQGIHISDGVTKQNYSLYLYGSYTRTTGYENPVMYGYAAPSTAGSINAICAPNPVINYYADYLNRPQIKLNAELDFQKEWKFWARYTDSGTTRMNTYNTPLTVFEQSASINNGDQVPATGVREYVFSLENDHNINNKLELKSSISYSSLDCERIDSFGDITGGFQENFAEDELNVKSLLRYTQSDSLTAAAGVEFSQFHLGPGWDGGSDDFVLNDGVSFVSGPNSPEKLIGYRGQLAWTPFIYTTSMDIDRYAVFGEVEKKLTSSLDCMLSARIDEYQYSEPMLSPRLAFIYNAEENGTYKLSFQRSLRANTLAQQLADHYYGNTSNNETLDTAEIIYSNKIHKNITADVSCFYNNANLLGWNPTSSVSAAGTYPQGTYTNAGIELSAEYKDDSGKLTLGLNESYIKELNFTLASGINSSFISYTDSHDIYNGVPINNTGSDRMNYPDQMTKIYAIVKPDDKWTLFGDIKGEWGYEGDKDWLEMYENGARGTAQAAAVASAVNNALNQGLFDPQFTLDISVSYKVSKPLSVTVYGMNLLKLTKTWELNYIMEAIIATEEPTVAGIKADYKF